MDRRAALSLIARFSVASVVPLAWVTGCDDEPESASNGVCEDGIGVRYVTRFNNAESDHDHDVVVLDAEELDAALEQEIAPYTVTVLESGGGDGDHQHVVDLSLQNIMSLKDGARIAKTTVKPDPDAHFHIVFIAC